MVRKEVKLSDDFKSQTTKAVSSILVFLSVYFLLVLFAIGLTILCIYAAILLASAKANIITIGLGIGLVSFGILIVIFLIKFIFKSKKVDYSHLTRIKRTDHPKLFELLDELVNEIGTSFPQKVYLSFDVNASVFYNSSFWSMFFPTRKNLQIGLGLVNSTTESELKAILAHEFGHFSQKSMKVGSYVYNLNHIIFDMLYDNDAYDKAVREWGDLSGYFAFFVLIALEIVKSIQWVLQNLYTFVNKNYLGLSREMEFHADEIAAHITGYEPLKTSLLRMDLCETAFNTVLSFYENKINENLKSRNIYDEHSYVMKFLATKNETSIINKLPNVTLEDLTKYNKSKLNIEDQWASHPSVEQRIDRLEKTNLVSTQSNNSLSWSLFENKIELQEQLTSKIFSEIVYEKTPEFNSIEKFSEEIKKEFINNTFPEIFNGFYDVKNPVPFDLEKEFDYENLVSFKELFSSKNVNKTYELSYLRDDINTITHIISGVIKIKTFDYDGKKYTAKNASSLLKELKIELARLEELEKNNDFIIYQFFLKEAKKQDKELELIDLYKKFFAYEDSYDRRMKIYTELLENLYFINEVTPFDKIKSNFLSIEPIENSFKKEIRRILEAPMYSEILTKEIKDNLELYISRKWEYFGKENYSEENLKLLFTSLDQYEYLVSKGYFLSKKMVLEFKASLIVESNVIVK
ncbi:M48 family metallopeptidase [Tenacibaculum tangerinum]|uniref:M48 family metallopeptidase n=1 Tax=Tenacibaculum tangerinum TaxID=3038772 RepID=A0ABY8L3X4_9FLAO|nr:M48 family metallopeptidase [Tenacibaculum tangerinum]WGH75796.1 M48 family metallopeptidase [Tenacibaculum tangerinum]